MDKLKHDSGKTRYDLVAFEPLEALAKTYEFGYKKYSNGKPDSGWREVEPRRYKAAMLRHLVEYLKDEDHIDEESGLPSLYHVLWNIWTLTYFYMTKEEEE